VDGRSGHSVAAEVLSAARQAAADESVQGIVVLDTAAKASFADFRELGFDAYLVRPVRPQSVLTHVGAGGSPRSEPASTVRAQAEPSWRAVAPRVLLVEDNDINALLARRMLEKSGCEPKLCANGRDAVDTMRRVVAGSEVPYDLILMDVHMPVLDGLEATRMIRALFDAASDPAMRRPPIVALTANAFDDDRRRCLDAGMDDYLAKPFDRDDLHRMLERWCAKDDRTRAA
jgi:CheY-like chemotaxis protein